jgi:Tol biopolymer transport system component
VQGIYTMNSDGSGVTLLHACDCNGENDGHEWSSDGTRIVFVESNMIYVMNADGSGLTALHEGRFPDWSPDGTRIAFQDSGWDSDSFDYNYEIFTMNDDGSGVTRLTNNGHIYMYNTDNHPAWSPDGTRIAYAFNGSGSTNPEIYVMNADGSGQTQLTNSEGLDRFPEWSPDGTKIVFQSSRVGFNRIWVMNADGSGQTALLQDFDQYIPAWSPDGTQIVYASDGIIVNGYNLGPRMIHVMNADGSNPTVLTTGMTDYWWPNWIPTGP